MSERRGKCDRCSDEFAYDIYSGGFGDTAFAYCNKCGCTALLSLWSDHPEGARIDQGSIEPDVERYLASCVCGGRFKADASPRCPHCHECIDADKAAAWIEASSVGFAMGGWSWQRSWKGFHMVVIEGNSVKDPWNWQA